MISKAKISQIRLLHQKKHRETEDLFIVEGTKSYFELLNSNLHIKETYVTQNWIDENKNNIQNSEHFYLISDKEMEKISCLSTPPEILCIVEKPKFTLEHFKSELPLIVLDDIKDPGNLGTIIRTADWFGIHQIFCSENCVEFTNPKVIQATMGSFTRVKIVNGNIIPFLHGNKNRKKFGMFMEGKPIDSIDFKGDEILIIGSESHGISEEISQLITEKIHIPNYHTAMNGAESLNASIASGILFYEFSKKVFQTIL